MTISFDDFLKVDIRSGTVVKAEPYPEARKPSLKVWIDFGPEIGTKKIIRPDHDALHTGNHRRGTGCRCGQFPPQTDRQVCLGMPGAGFRR